MSTSGSGAAGIKGLGFEDDEDGDLKSSEAKINALAAEAGSGSGSASGESSSSGGGSSGPGTASKTSTSPPVQPQALRISQQTAPVCTLHNCAMISNNTKGRVTTYVCPVKGCDTKNEKMVNPQNSAFAKPLPCPGRDCKGDGKKIPATYLEKDARLSQGAEIVMCCPKCKQKIRVPNPLLVAMQKNATAKRPPKEDLDVR